MEDLILTLPIIAGVDWHDPTVVPMPLGDTKDVDLKSLRVAFYVDNGMITPTPETVEVVKKTAKVLSDKGMTVEEDRPEGIEKSFGLWLDLFRADGGAEVRRVLQMVGTTELHPWLQGLLDRANEMTSPEFVDLMTKWHKFRSSMLSFMEKYDVIICPVNAFPALPHGGTLDKRVISVSYTMTYNLTGWPVAVVRAGTSPEGLPIGVQVVAHPWRENVALAVAKHIENVFGGWQPPPL